MTAPAEDGRPGAPEDGPRDGDHPGHGLLGVVRDLLVPGTHGIGPAVEPELETSARAIRATKVSLLVLGATALGQLAVAVVSGSVALLNDTLHNVADAATSLPLWLAFALGRRRPTDRYTYGYGRAEDVAGVAIVLAIGASAVFALLEALSGLLAPTSPTHLTAVFLAGVLGVVGNEVVARYRMRIGREIGSAALVADGMHARADTLTSFGVCLGVVGVVLGFPLADPLAGLLIAAVIVRVFVDAARDVTGRLMDAVDPAVVGRIRRTLSEVEGVEAVGDVRVRWLGHRQHAEVEILVDAALSVHDGHGIAERARHALLHEVPRLSSALVHTDPTTGDPHRGVAHHPDPLTRERTDGSAP